MTPATRLLPDGRVGYVAPGDEVCRCVITHVPAIHKDAVQAHHIQPLYMGGVTEPGNLVWLCGNAHNLVHALIRLHVKYDGTPGGAPSVMLGQISRTDYIRALAIQGYDKWVAAGRPGRAEVVELLGLAGTD